MNLGNEKYSDSITKGNTLLVPANLRWENRFVEKRGKICVRDKLVVILPQKWKENTHEND